MYQTDQINVLLQFLNQIPLCNLLMVEVVQKLHVGMVNFANDLKSLRYRGQIVLRIFFLIDILEQQCGFLFCRQVCPALERLNACLMMRIVGESLDTIAREHDDCAALKLFGDWEEVLQIGNELIASHGVGDARPHSSGSIEGNSKRAFLRVSTPKIRICPVVELLNQLDCVIASFCYSLQALLERKILVDSP